MRRRIFSLLLCICMMFSIMPIPSHAEASALEKMLAAMESMQQGPIKKLTGDSSADDGKTEESVEDEKTEDSSEDKQPEASAEEKQTEDSAEDKQPEDSGEEKQTGESSEDQNTGDVVTDQQTGDPVVSEKTDEAAEDAVVTESVTLEIPVEGDSQSGEDLLAQYVEQQMRDFGMSWFASDYGDSQMPDERNLQVYWALKEKVKQIAGYGGSTVTNITLEEPITVSFSSGTSVENIKELVNTAYTNAIDTGLILNCLLVDCPYELYWFDKTIGFRASYLISYDRAQGTATVTETEFTFAVASEYRSGGNDTVVKAPSASADVIAAAQEAALAVVAENAGKTDLGKLTGYKDYICRAVSYNFDAANNNATPYGNPWQLVWVFDGNSSTNVVCEGYAKAFQYLCELSEFTDEYFASYIMTGDTMTGDTGGGHMWNLVTLYDVNYLVDVTNADMNPHLVNDLFMNAAPVSGDESGFEVSLGGTTLAYTYYPDTVSLYAAEIRKLGQREHTYANGSSTCSVCGRSKVTPHTHSWSADWSSDGDGHWHSCSSCDQKGSFAVHTAPADDGTCTTAATCPTCGYVLTPAKSHSFTNDCDATCNNTGCSHTRSITHNLTRTAAQAATCMATGNREYWTCSQCGTFFSDANGLVTLEQNSWVTEKDSTRHVGTVEWVLTETTHKQAYTCCGAAVSAEADHIWTGTVCSVCGYGCKHTGGEASCTNQAVCTRCGNPYGDLKSHSLKKTNAVAATCVAGGNRAYWTCTACGKFFSDAAGTTTIEKDSWITERDASNHAYANTLTQGENTHYYACSRCGTRKDEAAHSYGSWQSGSNGIHSKVCICGHRVTETCTADVGGHKCSVCNGNVTPCTGGTATCTDRAVCEICGQSYGALDSGNHASDSLVYTDNEDGETHMVRHYCCHAVKDTAEAHSYADGACICGARESVTPGAERITVAVKKRVSATQNGLSKALTRADVHIADTKIVSVSLSVSKNVTRDWNLGSWFYNSWSQVSYDHTISFRGLAAGTTTVQVGDVTYKVVVTETGACSHSWVESSREEPGCTSAGQIEYLCSRCGSTKSESIPAAGHSYEDGVCTECGKTEAERKFSPKVFRATISDSQVRPDDAVTITVRTSTDVAWITVNGQKVTSYTTTSGYRVFTLKVSEDTSGSYSYQVYAYNADGIRSGTVRTLSLVVKNENNSWWMPWMSYFNRFI